MCEQFQRDEVRSVRATPCSQGTVDSWIGYGQLEPSSVSSRTAPKQVVALHSCMRCHVSDSGKQFMLLANLVCAMIQAKWHWRSRFPQPVGMLHRSQVVRVCLQS